MASILRGAARRCLVSARSQPLGYTPLVSQAFAVFHCQQTQGLNTLTNASNRLCVTPMAAPQVTVLRASSGGNHVKLWTAERALSVVLLGVMPLAAVYPTPLVETALALSLTLHSHWGIEALVHDYVRPSMFGNVIPKIAEGAVYLLSIVTFGSLCYFINFDVGLVNAFHMLWSL